MAASDALRKTALHAVHVAAGGRMVAFAGWEMPVQYTGVIDEHNAVRTGAGLFDVSHMGELRVQGSQALELLQHVTCNDVAKLKPGRAQYTGLTTPEGAFVDDLLIYMLDEGEYLLVTNAGNTPKDLAWMREHAGRFDVSVEDESDDWALLALQGPRSEAILQSLVEPRLQDVKYYRFVRTDVAGESSIVSRTGYTGEDGFEIYAPASSAAAVWEAVMRAGGDEGPVPVGLAARDTLRLEARMALYGNDIDDTTSPYEADLGWIVKLGKGEFVGRDVLARQAKDGVSRKLVGFEMRGRAIARHGYVAHVDGGETGRVTSGTFAPFLKKSIGLAYLPIRSGEPGTEFEVEIRGRCQPAIVVRTPFYRRAS